MSDSTATAPPAEGTKPDAPEATPPAPAPNESGTTGPVKLPDDHPLVKTLAAQKDEIKALKAAADSGKTDAEKTAERLAEVEKRATEAEARVLRREVALDPSGDGKSSPLSKADAALLDTISDEKAMRALAARLAGESDKKRNHVPREGNNPTTGSDDRRDFVRRLTGRT